MSLISIFTDAVKKAANSRSDAAKKAIDSGAAGTLGPTPQSGAGSFTPLRAAPGASSSSPLDEVKVEGVEPRVAGDDVTELRRPPSDFKIEGVQDLKSADPEAGGEVVGLRRPPSDLKIEEMNVAGDPAAGAEVSEAKVNVDSAFTRRLRESSDFKAEGAPDLKSSDPQEGGQVTELRRPPSDLKIEGVTDLKSADPEEGGEVTELRRSPSDIHIVKPIDKSSPILSADGGDGPPPTGSEGGGISELRRPPSDFKIEGVTDLKSSDPQEGGEITGLRRPPSDFKIEGVTDLKSADPEEGGEVVGLRRPPSDFKIEGLKVAGEPDGGGQVTELRRPPSDFKIEGVTDLKSSDPQEGGEITGLRRPPSDFKIEGVRDLQSSDPQEGGQVTELRRPPSDFKIEGLKVAGEPGAGGHVVEARRPPSDFKVEGVTDVKSSDPQEGGEFHRGDVLHAAEPGGGHPAGSDYFNVKIEETGLTQTPATPVGTPIPYPNLQDAPAHGDSGAGDLIAHKASASDQMYPNVHLKEAFITRDAPTGETHPGGIAVPGVQDHFQSSTLLDLHPEPAAGAHEMLPGLAGALPDAPDLDFDADDVDADTDESDL